AVGDDDGRAALEGAVHGALEVGLGLAVHVGGGLAEDEEGPVAVDRAGDGEELALAGAEVLTALGDLGVEPSAAVDHLERAHLAERLARAVLVDLFVEGDVLEDGAREEEDVLRDHAEGLAEAARVELTDVDAAHEERAL